jgi:type II secretion system protein J
MKKNCQRNGNRGFTLIEMILAVGVAAIVLISINAVFFSALHLRETTANSVDEMTPVEQAFAVLRRDLQCAVTPNGLLSGDFKIGNVTTLGISDMVSAEIYTADAALHENEPWAEIQRVTYRLKSNVSASGLGHDLIRGVTRNLLSSSTPDIEDQWMLGGVESIQFYAFDGSQWLNEWDTTSASTVNTNLPLAVRVRIQMAVPNNNGRFQPFELLVPIDSQSRTNSTS